MAITVKVYTHNNAIGAALWCIENMPHKNWVTQWAINDRWVDPTVWALEGNETVFRIIVDLINLNNTEMKKTHEVEFKFKNEEDAVWFKTVWGA